MERRKSPLRAPKLLLAQVQLLDDRAVTLDIDLLKVAKKVSSVADHLQHATAAVVVLVVGLQVLGEGVDAMGKDRDLNLGRTGVALVGSVLLNNGLLFVFQHGSFTFLFTMRQPSGRLVNATWWLYPTTEKASRNEYYNTTFEKCKAFFENFSYIIYMNKSKRKEKLWAKCPLRQGSLLKRGGKNGKKALHSPKTLQLVEFLNAFYQK